MGTDWRILFIKMLLLYQKKNIMIYRKQKEMQNIYMQFGGETYV